MGRSHTRRRVRGFHLAAEQRAWRRIFKALAKHERATVNIDPAANGDKAGWAVGYMGDDGHIHIIDQGVY